MEIEPQRSIFALIVFDHAFQYTDMEGYVLPVDWQQDGVIFVIDINEFRFQILWQLIFTTVAL